jgi:hypothetical protein
MKASPEAALPAEPTGTDQNGPLGHEPRGRNPEWFFLGPEGLRAGWSVLLAYGLFYLFRLTIGTVFFTLNLVGDGRSDYTATSMLTLELIPLFAMLGAGAVISIIERRSILDYNLSGPRPLLHFASGLGAGFVALSALIGALKWGGWLRFGPSALSGVEIFRFAALWGCTFLVVACVEEGLFRCYLQSTLTRGIDLWWALAAEIVLCLYLYGSGNRGAPGVYAVALLGVFPCLALSRKGVSHSGFWCAAWVTSTFFGLIHTFNNGENWIGIFAAASIGFVFCVSVRVTGSAWWAIGCHAAWDWTETFFYGTADSGLPARGHLLTTHPRGNPLLSGSTDGPEGSLLVLAAILLLLFFLIAAYTRRRPAAPATNEVPVD